MLDEHHAAYIFQALPEGVLLHGGGHQAAGGFAVAKEKIHFLEQELNDAILKTEHVVEEKNNTDAIPMNLGIVTVRHLQKLRALAPFGVGNPQPVFLFGDVRVVSTKMFGKNKEHLECNIEDTFGKAVAFNFFTDIDMKERIVSGAIVSLTGTLEAGWRGGVRVRIQALV
jgi:single-stranded-DNA-specific exonuclease